LRVAVAHGNDPTRLARQLLVVGHHHRGQPVPVQFTDVENRVRDVGIQIALSVVLRD